MPSIYDLLVGKTQEEYRMENPFFQAGVNLRQPMARPQTNAEALWVPALQGLLSGVSLGVGKQQADETAYGDYRKNPLVAALSGEAEMLPEAMPADWTANDGRQNLILKALQKQNADEIAQTEAEQLAKFNATYGPDATRAKAAQAVGVREALLPVLEQEQAMKGKLNPTGTKIDLDMGMGQASRDKILEQKALAEDAFAIADTIKREKPTWAEMRAGSWFSAFDKTGVAQSSMDLADRLIRSRSGATAPAPEKADLQKIVSGDFSAGPERVAEILTKFARREAENARSKLASSKGEDVLADLEALANRDRVSLSNSIGGNVPAGAVPTGRTMGGKPVYKLPSGELWAED